MAYELTNATQLETVRDALGQQFIGARAHLTSTDTAVDYSSLTDISFDAAAFDTDSFFSAGSPTRLTIPSGLGITHVMVSASVYLNNVSGSSDISFGFRHYDSGDTLLAFRQNSFTSPSGETTVLASVSDIFPVSAGDYFTAQLKSSDTSININSAYSGTSLSVHVIGRTPV